MQDNRSNITNFWTIR